MGVFVQESLSTRDESHAASSSGATEGGNSRTRALGQLQQTFDASPRVVAQAKQAQTLQRRASPSNDTGLPDGLKSGVEALSGMAMDDVRVHYNSSAPAQLQALAYTQGSDIHVAPGQEKHLAHEAWHVVQQKQGRVRPTTQLQGESLNDAPGLESEADLMGSRASGLKLTGPTLDSEPFQRKVAPVSGDTSLEPIQRVAVQLGINGAGNINNVNVGGRAGSLWPQERHHTTPWQTYLDTLDRALLNRNFAQALNNMNTLDAHLRNLPGWDLVDSLEAGKQEEAEAEIDELAARRAAANAAAADTPAQAFAIQAYAQQWIVVRSKLPLSQANFGGGAGAVAGDAAMARAGNQVGGGGVTNAELRGALLGLFDFDTVTDVQTDEDGNSATAEYRAFGLSPDDTTQDLDELRALIFEQHARSIRLAYPRAFARLYPDIPSMVANMEAHWGRGDPDDSDAEITDASGSESD
ncbi:DUF4157 domain-containing protein [Myxococcus sp. CA040A]|uniref:eCIS core domain-containing protein n=2 Tax=unclassified Myxococcus TaxID=2648731 RepID=UPI001C2D6D0E|nr:DUF4157 domain-containing protein [Myxococcus sp. CA040A]